MMPDREMPDPFDDLEKPHPLAAEFADGAPRQPLTVRLVDMWTDLLRVEDEPRAADAPPRIPSAMPLLDYMKGIMQWD